MQKSRSYWQDYMVFFLKRFRKAISQAVGRPRSKLTAAMPRAA